MSKQKPYKLKKYSRHNSFSGKPNRGPWKAIGAVLLVGLLVFVGISIYQPVTDYLAGNNVPDVVSEDSSDVPEPSQTEPQPVVEPEPEPEPKPEPVSGFHLKVLPLDTALDEAALDSFLDALPADCNGVLFETKTDQGMVTYGTSNEEAIAWGGRMENPVDLDALAEKLEARGLYLAVKMSVFSDPVAARGDDNISVKHTSGVRWIDNTIDNGGKPWASPYSREAWRYNQALAQEMAEMGAVLIVMDHVQFPGDPTRSSVHPETGESKDKILADFVASMAEALPQDVRTAVYLPIRLQEAPDGDWNTERYGGNPLKMVNGGVVLGFLDFTLQADTGSADSAAKALLETAKSALPSGTEIIAWVGAEDARGADLLGLDEYILQ